MFNSKRIKPLVKEIEKIHTSMNQKGVDFGDVRSGLHLIESAANTYVSLYNEELEWLKTNENHFVLLRPFASTNTNHFNTFTKEVYNSMLMDASNEDFDQSKVNYFMNFLEKIENKIYQCKSQGRLICKNQPDIFRKSLFDDIFISQSGLNAKNILNLMGPYFYNFPKEISSLLYKDIIRGDFDEVLSNMNLKINRNSEYLNSFRGFGDQNFDRISLEEMSLLEDKLRKLCYDHLSICSTSLTKQEDQNDLIKNQDNAKMVYLDYFRFLKKEEYDQRIIKNITCDALQALQPIQKCSIKVNDYIQMATGFDPELMAMTVARLSSDGLREMELPHRIGDYDEYLIKELIKKTKPQIVSHGVGGLTSTLKELTCCKGEDVMVVFSNGYIKSKRYMRCKISFLDPHWDDERTNDFVVDHKMYMIHGTDL